MDTKRFNAEHAAKSRAVCERIEREDAERRSKLGERERAILDMWPRFEDGECVWFGDEVEMQDEIVREVWTFTLDVNAEGDRRLYLNGFNGLFMLPGEPVKRPAPKVLDADGVEKKISEKVWSGLYDALTELRNDCEKLRHSDEATMPRLENDSVAFPAHYTSGGIECIDAMRAALTPDEFRGYLRGNVIKYVWRFDHKGAPVEDLRKAAWYLDRLTREVGRDDG